MSHATDRINAHALARTLAQAEARADKLLAEEAARRSEIAGQAGDLLARLPAGTRKGVQELMHRTSPVQFAGDSHLVLVELLAFITTAINEGWLDELVGRIEREAS